MKIAINALSAKVGGGITYLSNLIPKLADLGAENEYIVFVSYHNCSKLNLLSAAQKNIKIIKLKVPNLLIRLLKEYLLLPFILRKYKVDLLYSPANISPFFCPCDTVLLIQNIDPYIEMPREPFYKRIRNKSLRLLSYFSAKYAKKVMFLSNYSLRMVSKMLDIPDHKAVCVYLAVAPAKQKNERPIEEKYLLSVSNITNRKNFEFLIAAFNLLDEKIKKDLSLAILGNITDVKYFHALSKMVSALGLVNRVKFISGVDGDGVWDYYAHAEIFILPSLVENFPFTPLEAMSAGVPVLASNVTAIPESVGEAAVLFDPVNAGDLARKIESLLANELTKKELTRKGYEHVKKFNWENVARQTLSVFEEPLRNV